MVDITSAFVSNEHEATFTVAQVVGALVAVGWDFPVRPNEMDMSNGSLKVRWSSCGSLTRKANEDT